MKWGRGECVVNRSWGVELQDVLCQRRGEEGGWGPESSGNEWYLNRTRWNRIDLCDRHVHIKV